MSRTRRHVKASKRKRNRKIMWYSIGILALMIIGGFILIIFANLANFQMI